MSLKENTLSLNIDNTVVRKLFICIIVMLFPVAFSNIKYGNNIAMTTNFIAIMYVIEALILLTILMKNRISINMTQFGILILFFIVLLITQLYNVSIGRQININDIINILAKVFNIFILFIVITKVRINKDHFIKFVKLVLFLGLISCIYNIVKNFDDMLNINNLASSYEAEFNSFFANRNQFGIFMVISMISTFFVLDKENKIIYKLLIPIFIINLILTMSRTSILAIIIFIIVRECMNLTAKRALKNIYICLALGIIMYNVLIPYTGLINKMFIRGESISNASDRTDIWNMGLDVAMNNNFITGLGYFSAQEIAKGMGFEYTQFHSLYVDTLVSGGVVELALLAYIFYFLIKKIKESEIDRKMKYNFYAMYVAFIILSIFESCSFFSIGYVDTIFTIYFITIPILYSNCAIEKGNKNI